MQALAVEQFNPMMNVQQANLIAGHFIGFHPRDDLRIDPRPGIAHANAHAVA